MQAAKGYDAAPEDVREFFNYFNIGQAQTPSSEETPSNHNEYVSDGKISQGVKNPNGTYGVFEGDGNNGTVKGGIYTTFDGANDKPYLLNKERLQLFGLDDSFENSII